MRGVMEAAAWFGAAGFFWQGALGHAFAGALVDAGACVVGALAIAVGLGLRLDLARRRAGR